MRRADLAGAGRGEQGAACGGHAEARERRHDADEPAVDRGVLGGAARNERRMRNGCEAAVGGSRSGNGGGWDALGMMSRTGGERRAANGVRRRGRTRAAPSDPPVPMEQLARGGFGDGECGSRLGAINKASVYARGGRRKGCARASEKAE